MGKKCCAISLVVLSVLLLGGGIALIVATKPFVTTLMHNKLILTSKHSEVWDVFVDPASEDVTFQRKFWFFNLTNPEYVCNGTEVPNFVEVGPYVYNQHRYKKPDTISWSGDKSEISFEYAVDFTFNANLSVDETTGRRLSDQDNILTYNLAFFGAAYRIANMDPHLMTPFGGWFKNMSTSMINLVLQDCVTPTGSSPMTGVLQNGLVADRIWGYKDKFWQFLLSQTHSQKVDFATPTIARLQWNHSLPAPDSHINVTAGQRCPMWDNLSQCDTTTNSKTTLKTGGNDYKQMGEVTAWAGRNDMPWWGEGCRDFGGATDGTQFKPGLTSGDRPNIFVDVAYRPIGLQFVEASSVSGIDALRFGIAEPSLETGAKNPNNKCFDQYRRGFLNLTAAAWAPLLVSKAHFLDADTTSPGINFTVSNHSDGKGKTNGFAPVRQRDDSFLDIEPNTGAPLEIRVRMQINFPVGPVSSNIADPPVYDRTKDLVPTLAPIVLTEDYMHISPSLEKKLKDNLHKVHLAETLGKIAGIVFIVASGIALGGSAYLFLHLRRHGLSVNDGDDGEKAPLCQQQEE
eukprot:PhM_4_TR4865/c0_g1_i1/m.59919/K12384/SCARB2, LIMP2, CD36L2; lysosome membrane protein 2